MTGSFLHGLPRNQVSKKPGQVQTNPEPSPPQPSRRPTPQPRALHRTTSLATPRTPITPRTHLLTDIEASPSSRPRSTCDGRGDQQIWHRGTGTATVSSTSPTASVDSSVASFGGRGNDRRPSRRAWPRAAATSPTTTRHRPAVLDGADHRRPGDRVRARSAGDRRIGRRSARSCPRRGDGRAGLRIGTPDRALDPRRSPTRCSGTSIASRRGGGCSGWCGAPPTSTLSRR